MRAPVLAIVALAMLAATSLVAGAEPKTCFSRQHRQAAVNVRVALTRPGAAIDSRAVQSEKDCILACCSEEVKPGAKCNMAVFKSQKPGTTDNCLLFHCEMEQDCPLMMADDGINTYDIFKGLILPTTVRPPATTTVQTTHTAAATQASSTAQPTTATTATEATTAAQLTTAVTLPITSTTSTTTTTTTTTTTPATTTAPPTTVRTTATTMATTSMQPATSTATTTTPPPPPIIVITTLPSLTQPATTTGAPTTTGLNTQRFQSEVPRAAMAHSATGSAANIPAARKPSNKTTRKQAKTQKRVKPQPVHATTAPGSVQSKMPVRGDGDRTTQKPKPEAMKKKTTPVTPATTTTTTTTTATTSTTTTTTTTQTTTTAATEPDTTRTATSAGVFLVAKGETQPNHTLQGQGKAAAAATATTAHGALKSGLVVVMVVGLAALTMALAVGGRKAMESFDRRHYTRLELNDLHYEV